MVVKTRLTCFEIYSFSSKLIIVINIILCIIFIFRTNCQNVSYVYLLRLHNEEPLHETIGGIGIPALCIFSLPYNLGAE